LGGSRLRRSPRRVARDRARAERTLEGRREVAPQLVHQAHIDDLSILGDIRDVGARIAAEEPRIDVLINNACNLFARRGVTAAGWCTVLTNIRSR
jgi:NAD(P)-dependent dehydrogenase (short-subunit alcohol dehydrogenase family)